MSGLRYRSYHSKKYSGKVSLEREMSYPSIFELSTLTAQADASRFVGNVFVLFTRLAPSTAETTTRPVCLLMLLAHLVRSKIRVCFLFG
ncbi:hypothetical protein [Leuconostoc suionicum]|uniref:hypothetical protein n=1 Tax=Leuconostoc suionicum TaxID=1511761 RepID=UPI00233F4425|nr:hypothetical protein [Leuconostoc suionicum]MDC2804939.1 hypothetical protein [Leuconostoc suionicum]MDC2822451.1 hypothetical protein [Leuconostoc suionicum]